MFGHEFSSEQFANNELNYYWITKTPVSYTHLTLPTILRV